MLSSAANCGSASDVADVVDRRDRRLRLLERGDDLVARRARAIQTRDRLVELVGVLGPFARRRRTRVRRSAPGRPTRRITRSAIDCALVEIATQRPSLVR